MAVPLLSRRPKKIDKPADDAGVKTWTGPGPRAVAAPGRPPSGQTGGANPMDLFPSENQPPAAPAPPRGTGLPVAVGITLGLLALAAGAAVVVLDLPLTRPASTPTPPPVSPAPAPPITEGTVVVSTRPEGANVSMDGILKGVTPLRLTLPAGDHTLELQNGTATRSLPVTIVADTVASHYVDLAPGASATTGRLEVVSDPPGARVSVDGAARGVTPLNIASISPGSHAVVISNGDSTVNRTVRVVAGATATVVASMTPAGSAAGWVTISVPLELQIREEGRLLGTTSAARLMLPAGRHELELVNTDFQFQTTLSVDVVAGKVATSSVTLPNGTLSINALPWADVWLDGRSLGPTPLANLSVPIGRHEIVWRHPQLGERRQTVSVTAQAPVRVGIDFNK